MSRLITSLLAAVVVVAVVSPPGGAAVPDHDGDGVAGATDCRPLDPTIFPAAPDEPDPAFIDSNCDGIDGSAADAVFVSVSGSSGGLGTQTNPLASIQAGIAAAVLSTPAKDVYVTGGNFTETLAAADGVGIYGGYTPGTWVRSPAEVTTVTGSPQALLADGDDDVVLQMLTLRGTVGGGSLSAYGLRAINGSQVLLSDVDAFGGAATAGANGSTGGTGATGAAGLTGGLGCTPGGTTFGPGGFGGAGGVGGLGGVGGFGVTGGSGGGALGGSGGTPAAAGGNGQSGSNGATAANNALTLPAAATWPSPTAGGGFPGGSGAGGGGGGGGTGQTVFFITFCGGGGGSGGSGGGGGSPGGGGQNGGGSFGGYVVDSTVTAVQSSFTAANGGKGGNGGPGGFGGPGGARGTGGLGDCTGCVGAIGGLGGAGGRGGGGGAGAGGPSAAVYQAGAASRFVAVDSTLTHGAGGAAGTQGNTGVLGTSGTAAELLRSPTAPTTPGDYDGDAVLDDVDGCPAVAAGSFDTNPADGCPDDRVKPVLLLGGSAKQRMLATKVVAFTAKTGEACSLTATAKLGTRKLGAVSARALPADTNRSYKIKLDAADLKAIRSALGRRGDDYVKVAVACVDPAGNRGAASKRIRIVR